VRPRSKWWISLTAMLALIAVACDSAAEDGGDTEGGDGGATIIRFAFAPDPVWDWMTDTAMLAEWNRLRQWNPAARLVCIDVQPAGTTQALERPDVLNVGGFSDQVFDVVAEFASGRLAPGHWVDAIEAIAV